MPESSPARRAMEDALNQSDQVMIEGRDRVRDLRMSSVETNDLPNAFAMVGKELEGTHPASFSVSVKGDCCRELHPIVRDEFYRIGREALTNAFRHAKAEEIEAEITYEHGELRFRVRDDGCGIEPGILAPGYRSGHWGITGMRERAQQIGAQMDIWSRPGIGTEIDLKIPAGIAYRTSVNSSRCNGCAESPVKVDSHERPAKNHSSYS